ncbi:hypothetical protein SAMN05216275_11354 [Streptosporangium canum]|uniref:Uncharacterized protein n=1 Tax=Streptosporangium canum TaxID=324952 RepID=A0A1I3UTH4_9ACTN|nr:hypothetical protein [Streptosporangium canum]SFJ85386.1 hypothetical protein SAMN05216275_11354 [Streptosporangium canum]
MSAHNSRLPVPTLPESTYRQAPSPSGSPSGPATNAGLVRPGHRIAVLVVIIVVVVVFQLVGQAPTETLAVILLAAATATKVIAWLVGQPDDQQDPGGPS